MKKELIYILKRVIIGVFIAVILFSIKSCQVKALTNTPIGQDVEFPTGNATFLSMNENYRFTNVGFRYFHGSTLNPTLYFASPTTNNITCGTYGCGINIDGLSVVKDSYYSITIFLIGSNSPFWHYSYSSLTNKIGVSNGYSSINSNYFVSPTSGTTSTSRSCNSIYDNEYTGNCLFQWTLIFKAPRNGTSVQTWWSSNPSGADPQNNGLFVGYTFKYIGDSSLTPEQLQSALNTATTNITNNNNQNTQSIINNQNNNTQQIISEQQNTTQAIEDLNDSITSEAPPNLSSLNNSAGWLPPGPVDSILNLPLALLNNINTNLSKTCQPVILHIPLVDSDLPIPCITTLYEQMGIMTWVNTIGAIASAFILFSYFVKLYKWVDDTLTFRENNYIDNWGGV